MPPSEKFDNLLLFSTRIFNLTNEYQSILTSLYLISASQQIENPFSRMYVLIASCHNLLSIKNNLNNESPCYILLCQNWFVQLWNSPNKSLFREELTVSLINSAFLYEDKNNWHQRAFEVADLCTRVLDWEIIGENTWNLIAEQFMILVDNISIYEAKNPSIEKLSITLLEDIRERFIEKDWNNCKIKEEYTKQMAILLLSKHWIPKDMNSNNLSQQLQILFVI